MSKDNLVYCVDIRDYLPSEEAVAVEGSYYKKGSKHLVRHHFTKEWLLVTRAIKVLVAEDKQGFINKSECDCLPKYYMNGNFYTAYSEALLQELNYIKGKKSGMYFKKSEINLDFYPDYENFLVDNTKELSKLVTTADKNKYGVTSNTNMFMENIPYSFGIEIETSSGFLPSHAYKGLNVKSVRDGSIHADRENVSSRHGWAEYVTGVLKGDKGIEQLQAICAQISNYCGINYTCSVHVHVGGLNFNNSTIVSLYKTCLMLEKEIFSMLPPSRNDNEYCRNMEDSTCLWQLSNEEKVEEAYEIIFGIISTTKRGPNNDRNKKTNHPLGSKCSYDKNTPRYWWINFVPAMFVTRGVEEAKTIEFRNHSATTNFKKISNWLKICMAIVNYAENNKQSVFKAKKLTLEEVIKFSYKNSRKLLEYVEKRKIKFSETISEGEEYVVEAAPKKSLKEILT